MFQSTYLYKVRLYNAKVTFATSCFNPRTYIRYDQGVAPLVGLTTYVSIHVPI